MNSAYLMLAAKRHIEADPGVIILAVIIAAAVGIPMVLYSAAKENKAKEKRRVWLQETYQCDPNMERIIAKTIWVGETATQLRDSLGPPVDKDEKVLKTKTKVIWKYHHQGGNRYGLRITVENGVVVGWDEKM